jgi:hypothetical protein
MQMSLGFKLCAPDLPEMWEADKMKTKEVACGDKKWKYFEFEQCPCCGNDLYVFNNLPYGYVNDGDAVRCYQCKFKSGISVDDEEVWVQVQ